MNGDWRTWGVYLHDDAAGFAEKLNIRIDASSTAFTNPMVVEVMIDGRLAIVVSLFVPTEGARGDEAGGLIYYRILDSASSL